VETPASWGGYDVPQPTLLQWKNLAEIEAKAIEFLDYPFLQRSCFHLLTGVKNAGKGTWLAHMTARMTRGELGERERVLWLSLGEDDYAYDVKPRVLAAGGDVSKVTILEDGDFELPRNGLDLEDVVREHDVGMVVIDPLGGSILGSRNDEDVVRPALRALNHLAAQTGTSVIGVRHVSNKLRTRADGGISATLGHSDWINVPRCVLTLLHDDVVEDYRHLFVLTGNRTRDGLAGRILRYRSVDVEGVGEHPALDVVGESPRDPDELLGAKRKFGGRSKLARRLLLEILSEAGGVLDSDLLDSKVAIAADLTTKTVRNLRGEMSDKGLIKPQPLKDENGFPTSWQIVLTAAGHLELSSTPTPQGSLRSSTKQNTAQSGSGKLQANSRMPDLENPGTRHLQVNGHVSADSAALDPLEMAEVFDAREEMS
jgi:hypothetical protein